MLVSAVLVLLASMSSVVVVVMVLVVLVVVVVLTSMLVPVMNTPENVELQMLLLVQLRARGVGWGYSNFPLRECDLKAIVTN